MSRDILLYGYQIVPLCNGNVVSTHLFIQVITGSRTHVVWLSSTRKRIYAFNWHWHILCYCQRTLIKRQLLNYLKSYRRYYRRQKCTWGISSVSAHAGCRTGHALELSLILVSTTRARSMPGREFAHF